jgi:poly-gamma-glutamate system protein
VTASFSGSFPGLNLALMAACRALDVRVLAVSSVTASTWGANEAGFTWPEMEVKVVAAGALPAATIAGSVGGTADIGRDLGDEGLALARRIQRETAAALHARQLDGGSLAESVELRIAAYRAAIGGGRPAAYVNVGGNHASLGGASADWRHDGGWLAAPAAPRPASRSVVAWYLADGVPVLSLLDLKALARRWGVV